MKLKTPCNFATEIKKAAQGDDFYWESHAEALIAEIQLHTLNWAASQIIEDGNPLLAKENIRQATMGLQ